MPFDVDDLDARAPARRHAAPACPAGWPAAASASTSRSTRPTTDRLALTADGPVGIDVAYELRRHRRRQRGPRLRLRPPGGGITGRLLAEATAALLSAGALDARRRRASRALRRVAPPDLPHPERTPCSTHASHGRPRRPPHVAVAATAVTRRYGEGESAVDALRGVSLEVPAGQFTAVMGPSGSGKSTLMHLLAGLDTPDRRHASTIGGEDITAMADKQLTKLRRQHIGFVFQAFNLLPTLTAEENILLPLAIAGRKPTAGRRRRADRARRPRRAPRPPAGASSPAASSSASPSPAR